MRDRVFGLETEFGCFVRDPAAGDIESVVETVKNHIFAVAKLGLIDLHARNYAFEPARSGGFLRNGARLYVDAVGSHEEYATAECRSLADLVAQDKAGHRILQEALQRLDLDGAVSFHNNSVDHFGGHTFGCHENYLVEADDNFFRHAIVELLPFLITRQIYAGVGRVGGHRLSYNFDKNVMQLGDHEVDYIWVSDFYAVELDDTVDFQLSQRADHIVNVVSSRVRFNRAIINPKRESYYDFSNRHRLHILFGEANMSEYATFLKVGTTSLVLQLIEMGATPPTVRLDHPIRALRQISRDPTRKWRIETATGERISAAEIQYAYYEKALQELAGQSDETDTVLREWGYVLDQLDRNPMALANRLDWVAKYRMFEEFMVSEGVDWQDDVLQSLDMEYHNVDAANGLYYALAEMGDMVRIVDDERIALSCTRPPQDTRAAARGAMVDALLAVPRRRPEYIIDWDLVYLSEDAQLRLRDPFHTYDEELATLRGQLGSGGK